MDTMTTAEIAQSIRFAVEADLDNEAYLYTGVNPIATHRIIPAYYGDHVLVSLTTGERIVDGYLTDVAREATQMGLTPED